MNSLWIIENGCQEIAFDLLLQKFRAKGHSVLRIGNFEVIDHKKSSKEKIETNCGNVFNVIYSWCLFLT